MHYIAVRNINVEVVKKNIKNIHLAVYPPNGRVRIAAPIGVNDETIKLYTISKLAWIKRQQRKFKQQDRQSERKYIQRESHYFLGKRYLLKVVEKNARPFVQIKNKTYLEIQVRPGATIEQKHNVINEWYRIQLKIMLPLLIDKWERKIGVAVEEWGIKQMKTKWGTCNTDKQKIWLNLELAKKPIHCIEYILVHEMVHLLERNHNDLFQAYMDKYLPNWRTLKDELNKLPVSHIDWYY
jgi:predicted metal-dependent hydrolase